jgi:flavin reductase (DIM6/NTAB) family NADH-FMN oxidoreductase RutF
MIGDIAAPVYIVTTVSHDGERSGCLATFATPVSIAPHRFLAGISKLNHTFGVAARASHLAVHCLGANSRDLAALFGECTGDTMDKFERCAWVCGPGDLPILTEAAAWFTGRILERVVLGDHTGYLLEPEHAAVAQDGPYLTTPDIADFRPGHPG